MKEEDLYLSDDEVEFINPKDVASEVETELQRCRDQLARLRAEAPFDEDVEEGGAKDALFLAYKDLDALISFAADVHTTFMHVQRI